MPYPVTLFSVKIASPRDVAMEAAMACDVLRDWNAAHALADKIVLLPLLEEKTSSDCCDVLVVFFHLSAAGPAPINTGELEPVIEACLQEKRPVFIYFSEARFALTRAGDHCEGTLQQVKDRYASRATIDSFNDEKEFRAKFANQLEATIRSHLQFGLEISADELLKPDHPKPAPSEGVSDLAQQLLIEACQDPEAYIGRFQNGDVLKLQANGQQFVQQGDPASAAKWSAAFEELLHGELIHDAGCNGRLFQISSKGFTYLKTLGHAPIGYIAELGSV